MNAVAIRSTALVLVLAALAACESAPRQRDAERDALENTRVLRDAEPARAESAGPLRVSRVSPPAMLAGEPVAWAALHDAMVEAAGALALEEAVLDRLLEAEAERRGLSIEQIDIQREEMALERALAGVSSDDAARRRMLEELRRERGLGPERYEALLRRTALMRALIKPQVEITPETLDLAMTVRFGEKRRVRLIATNTLIEAQTALRRLDRGEDFAEVAARFSTDASASRGGVIEPFSPADPSYPAAFRETAETLTVGEVSAPVALPSGYVILKLEEVIPAEDVELATVRPLVVEDARLEQERILMTRLARRLLSEASLTILDPALERAWNRRRDQ